LTSILPNIGSILFLSTAAAIITTVLYAIVAVIAAAIVVAIVITVPVVATSPADFLLATGKCSR
jgi:hypothetical protein